MQKPYDKRVLVVDDDEDVLLAAKIVLKSVVKKVQTENEPHGIPQLLENFVFDLVLLDMNFTTGFTSGKEGLRWLKKIKKISPQTHVILMTAYGEVNVAVKAMKEGATDFVLKPWDNEELLGTVEKTLTESATPLLKSQSATQTTSTTQTLIIGEAPAMQEVFRIIDKVAPTDANVLILGENGTGKELFARSIHEKSKRADKPFVHVDLGAISENLFESELFGHVKGAFTDAREDRPGRFEAAQGGTLFLDEIGNLSAPLQAKLLTALQSRSIQRVGSHKSIPVDIRLISATNMPLHKMVANRTFRQDLIYRINTVEITLPPLRERPSDIPILLTHFLKRYNQKYQLMDLEVGTDILQKMQSFDWPGNVRELQHLVERAVIMEDPQILIPDSLEASLGNHATQSQNKQEAEYNLEEVEKKAIQQAIYKHNGNISKAAKELGLGRTTLYRKMDKYGL